MTRRTFAEVATELGLAETMVADVKATIRPKIAGERQTTDVTLDAPLAARGRSDVAPRALARIPIHVPKSGLAQETTDDHGADLVVRYLLAEGGMGRIFVAEQRSLSREVVVKTVRDKTNQAQTSALIAEATITGTLEHPNITPVHLVGTDDEGAPLLVMKRIDGVTWSALLDNDERAWSRVSGLSRDRARAHIEILMQVASAVHFAHGRGIVHRDIKPDNVMVGTLGDVYVVDWGIAIEQRDDDEAPRQLVGTPCFAAPEMLGAGKLGPFTDVYLLGATLHVILTGNVRHDGNSSMDVLAAAWTSAPYEYPNTIPDELAALANAATAREPEGRPESALAFRRALADHLEHLESLRLAADGAVRVEELVALRVGPAPDALRQARLVAEARFAFQRALASWPDNSRAATGMKACLVEALEIELARDNLEASRALASEIASLPQALTSRIEALAELVKKRTEDAARLSRLDHDTDLGLAARDRMKLFVGLTALSLASGLALVRSGGEVLRVDRTSGKEIFLAALAVAVAGLVAVVVVRRHILVNRMNRQLVAVVAATVLLVLVHRALGWWTSADAILTLRTDLLLLALPCFVTAIFVRSRVAVLGVLLVAASALATQIPGATALVFVGASVVATIALPWALRDGPRATGE